MPSFLGGVTKGMVRTALASGSLTQLPIDYSVSQSKRRTAYFPCFLLSFLAPPHLRHDPAPGYGGKGNAGSQTPAPVLFPALWEFLQKLFGPLYDFCIPVKQCKGTKKGPELVPQRSNDANLVSTRNQVSPFQL